MPLITLTHTIGCEAEKIAKRIADKLNLTLQLRRLDNGAIGSKALDDT